MYVLVFPSFLFASRARTGGGRISFLLLHSDSHVASRSLPVSPTNSSFTTDDPNKSSTVQIFNPKGTFSIQYGTEGSNVTGNYITDDFSVGAASVKNLTMAYATYAAYVPTGIMGIGFDTNEAITEDGSQPYQNFVDVLKSQNVIDTKAYSLWLNDLGMFDLVKVRKPF